MDTSTTQRPIDRTQTMKMLQDYIEVYQQKAKNEKMSIWQNRYHTPIDRNWHFTQ